MLRRTQPGLLQRIANGPTATPGAIRQAAAWTIVELLRQPSHVCRGFDNLPFPGIISDHLGASTSYTHQTVLDSKNIWMKASFHTPPTKRARQWIRSSQTLLTQLSGRGYRVRRHELERKALKEVRWEISWIRHASRAFTIVMVIPLLKEIERGALPVWSVYAGEYLRSDDLPPDPLSSTDQGIYPALSEAGILVLDTDYDAWVATNSSPGNLAEDLSMYQLLGLRIPYLLPESEFQEWLAGKDL